MLSALLGMVLTTAAKDLTGKVTGKARISMTKAGANLTGAGALWAILPLALQGDEQAIGQLVMLLIGWGGVLLGRWRAEG